MVLYHGSVGDVEGGEEVLVGVAWAEIYTEPTPSFLGERPDYTSLRFVQKKGCRRAAKV